jgi:hypothetical protein
MEYLLPLEEKSLLEKACRKTSLNDFGSKVFLQPFRLLLKDLNQYNQYTAMGRITTHTILQQQLCARLTIEDRLKNDSSFGEQKIDRPLIIAGLPRTGTTHLHNLLSQVNSLRYLPFWQTLDPVLATSNQGKWDPRRLYNRLRLVAANYILPLFRRMHEMELDTPHEELTLSALCYRSFFFEGAFQVPNYRDWYAAQDNTQGYEYLKSILQILQTEEAPGNKRRNARWIMKSPQHVDQLDSILMAFPDAKIILTHRDPVRAVLSMITMILYASRQVYRPTRLREESRAWVDRLEGMLRRSQQQAQRLSPSQVLDIHFDEFMADPLNTIRQIQQFADIEIDDQSQRAIRTYLDHNTRDRHGRIDYHFEDLGLDEAEIKERFAFYRH